MATYESDIIGEFCKIYDSLNCNFFDSELPNIVITIGNGSKKVGVRYINKLIIMAIPLYEITLPIADICADMLHVMVHLHNHVNEIDDTSRNNTYHNKNFKREALKRGLIVDKDPTYGHSNTSPGESVYKFCEEFGLSDFDIDAYIPPDMKPTSKDKVKSSGLDSSDKYGNNPNTHMRKWRCPSCKRICYTNTDEEWAGCFICGCMCELEKVGRALVRNNNSRD